MDDSLISKLLNLSLYQPIELTEEQMDEYNSLNDRYNSFEANSVRSFCPFCNDISVFKISGRAYYSGHETIQYIKDEHEPDVDSDLTLIRDRRRPIIYADISNVIILSCSLEETHQIALFLQIINNSIIKVGQYPSFSDLQRDKKDSINSCQKRTQEKSVGLLDSIRTALALGHSYISEEFLKTS